MTSFVFMSDKKENPKHRGSKLTTRFPRALADEYRAWLNTNAEHFRKLGMDANQEDVLGSLLLDFIRLKSIDDQLSKIETWLPELAKLFHAQQVADAELVSAGVTRATATGPRGNTPSFEGDRFDKPVNKRRKLPQ